METYPEKEEDGDEKERVDGLPERELCSLCPLVVIGLQRVLLKDTHRAGQRCHSQRSERSGNGRRRDEETTK